MHLCSPEQSQECEQFKYSPAEKLSCEAERLWMHFWGISPLSPLPFLAEEHSLCWMAAERLRWLWSPSDGCLGPGVQIYSKGGSLSSFVQPGETAHLGIRGLPAPNSAMCAEEQGFILHLHFSLISRSIHFFFSS